jgi:hypothetical protein
VSNRFDYLSLALFSLNQLWMLSNTFHYVGNKMLHDDMMIDNDDDMVRIMVMIDDDDMMKMRI